MFYAHFVLAKKGPLARIWLAAHWDKKLTKAHVFETNIESSVEGILQPKVKMALRTSGHLLLGIVRIYSRKAKYLLADCNEAFIKIKMAFRPGMVDLPEGNREAAVSTITLPEVFHDFDASLPDITVDMDAQVTLNQSRAEDITMKEDYGTLSLITDDGFEDMGFDENDPGRDAINIDDGFDHTTLLLCEDQSKGMSDDGAQSSSNGGVATKSLDVPLKDDGFGGTVGEGLLDGETGGLFEPAGLFDDAPLDHVTLENNSSELHSENTKELQHNKPEVHENSDEDMYDMCPGSIDPPSPPSSTGSPLLNTDIDVNESGADVSNANATSSLDFVDIQFPSNSTRSGADIVSDIPQSMPLPPVAPVSELEQTTLINNEDESFALAPLDATVSQGLERSIKTKRKRKLIVDEVKNISGEEMKAQLSDTTDIVTTLDLAPPTKRLMHWKETGGVEKLFALPGHTILSRSLSKAYTRHLTTRSVDNEEFGLEEDHIDLDDDIEQVREDEIMVSRKRRRECDSSLHHDLSHLDNSHLDESRPSYTTDHNLSHPPLDVSSFFQPPQHHMFSSISTRQLSDQSQQQMLSNAMSTVMSHHPPPAHMIHPLMQNDVNQLSHLSQMMHHQMIDTNSSLHSMTANIHNVPSPVVSEAYNQPVHHSVMEPVSQHLISDDISPMSKHMQHHPIEKRIANHPSFQCQMTHVQHSQPNLQETLSQTTVNHMTCVENALHPCSDSQVLQPPIDTHTLHNTIDDDITQPLLNDQYTEPHNERKLSSFASTSQPLVCDASNSTVFNTRINTNQGNQIQQTVSEMISSAEKDTNPILNVPQPESSIYSSGNKREVQDTENLHNKETAENESSKFPLSEDEDDYGAPASVGLTLPEEQMADETYEQFEERILTKRTTHMLHAIQNSMDKNKSVSFAELVKNNKRKQVAQKFYTFLVLKKQQAVELEQNTTFGDMIITKGPKFNAVYTAN